MLLAISTFLAEPVIGISPTTIVKNSEKSGEGVSVKTYNLTKGKVLVTNLQCYGKKTGAIEIMMAQSGWTSVLSGDKGIIMTGKENVKFDQLPAGEYMLSMTGPEEGETQQVYVEITSPAEEKLSLQQITPYDCGTLSAASLEISSNGIPFYECSVINSMGYEIHHDIVTTATFSLEQLKGDVYYVEYETGCSTGKLEADLRDDKQVNARISPDQIQVETLEDQAIRVTIKPDLINATHCEWKLDDGTSHEGDDYTAIFNVQENHTLLFTAENESCKYSEVLSLHASDLPELSSATPMPYASAFIENNQLRISLRQLQYASTNITIVSEDGRVLWSENIKDTQKSDSEINLTAFQTEGISVIVTNQGMPIFSREFRI